MADGAKLTDARVRQRFGGDIEGEGSAQWVMWHRPDGTAQFVGLQKVEATVDGRSGTFVLETRGDFDGEAAVWDANVIPGSGTDGLAGLNGSGRFRAPHGTRAEFRFDFSTGE
jgi:hypothetical protein